MGLESNNDFNGCGRSTLTGKLCLHALPRGRGELCLQALPRGRGEVTVIMLHTPLPYYENLSRRPYPDYSHYIAPSRYKL